MWKKDEGLLEALKNVGCPLPVEAVKKLLAAQELDPDATTEDLVLRLSLAPAAAVEKAIERQHTQGSTMLLAERFKSAARSMRGVRNASAAMGRAAGKIVVK